MIIHDIVLVGEWQPGDLRCLSVENYIAPINAHRLNIPHGVLLISPEHASSASRRNKVTPSSLSKNLFRIAVELVERTLVAIAIPSFSLEDDLPCHSWRIDVIVAGDKQIGESMIQVDLRINGIVKILNLRLETSI